MEYHCYVFNRLSHLSNAMQLSADNDVEACVVAEELAIRAEEDDLQRVELWQDGRRIYSRDVIARGNA